MGRIFPAGYAWSRGVNDALGFRVGKAFYLFMYLNYAVYLISTAVERFSRIFRFNFIIKNINIWNGTKNTERHF
jgi:hypothetical protein